MAAADITSERLRELLSYDPATGIFKWLVSRGGNGGASIKAGAVAGCLCRTHLYVLIRVDQRLYPAHRLAWFYVHGKWPENEIDHRNGNRSDNRIDNLRDVSRRVNTENKRIGVGVSGLIGAHWFKPTKTWCSRIGVNGAVHHLGYFKTAEEAHQAYLAAKRRLHEGCTI